MSRPEFRFEHVAHDESIAAKIRLDLAHQIGRQRQANGQ